MPMFFPLDLPVTEHKLAALVSITATAEEKAAVLVSLDPGAEVSGTALISADARAGDGQMMIVDLMDAELDKARL